MCSRDYGRCVVLALPDERDRLRCGARDTDGLPCLARPLFGNARVGVCVADGGDDDASCRRLVEFESGCRCAAAVVTEKKQCEVSLHGVVSARLSHSDERRGVANQQVELYRSSRATRDGKAQFDYVAHQLTAPAAITRSQGSSRRSIWCVSPIWRAATAPIRRTIGS